MPRPARFDSATVFQVAQAQAGLITAAQLSACRVPPSSISYRTRPGGMWSRLLPGVHLLSPGPPDPLQRDVAALLYAGAEAVVTGLSALRHHGVGGASVPEGSDYVHVLVPHTCHRGSAAFVRVERTRRMPEPMRSQTYPPLALAPPERALADATRHMCSRGEVMSLVIEAVRREAIDLNMLAAEVQSGQIRGSAHLREALTAAGSGAWSPAEADVLPLIEMAGLPQPLLNHRLLAANGSVIAIPDAWIDDIGLAIEVDSHRFHSAGDNWDRTIARNAAYARAGVTCLPLTPRQIAHQPDGVVAALREAAAAAASRTRPNVRAVPLTVADPAPRPSVKWGG